MAEPTSSLLTKGSNQGSFSSPMGADSYDSFVQRQIEAEFNASRPSIGSDGVEKSTEGAFQTLSDTIDYKKLGTKGRRYFFNWDFSLNEAKANPAVTIKQLTKSDWINFQKKQVGTEGGPAVDQKRGGDLDHIVIKRITVKSVQTSSLDGLALDMEGIKGNAYGIGTGIRSPFFINPESNAYGLNEVIHELDETRMKMAELRYTTMNREYLDKLTPALPKNKAMVTVPVDSEITEVLAKQKNPLLPKMNQIKVFNGGTHFVLPAKLADKIKDQILKKRQNISLPTTSLWNWKCGLLRADGLDWSNTEVALKMSGATGLVGEELLNARITTNVCVEIEWFNLSDQKWNDTAPTTE